MITISFCRKLQRTLEHTQLQLAQSTVAVRKSELVSWRDIAFPNERLACTSETSYGIGCLQKVPRNLHYEQTPRIAVQIHMKTLSSVHLYPQMERIICSESWETRVLRAEKQFTARAWQIWASYSPHLRRRSWSFSLELNRSKWSWCTVLVQSPTLANDQRGPVLQKLGRGAIFAVTSLWGAERQFPSKLDLPSDTPCLPTPLDSSWAFSS